MPRPRPLENRLGQVEGQRSAATLEQGVAGIRERRLLRAEAALGEIIREALARAGVDAAGASRLALADDAAAVLAAIPDTAQLRHADAGDAAANGYDRARADMFAPKLIAMTRRYAGGARLDFADASFAELLAWSLAQNAAENPSAAPGRTGAAAGERVAMPDLEPDKTGGTGPSVCPGPVNSAANSKSGKRVSDPVAIG
jgi:hypothetical protein